MAMTLLSTQTADGDTTLSFTASAIDGFNSTYKLYIFKILDCNPETDTTEFTFQGSIDAGSNYNVAITSTVFSSQHQEDNGANSLGYISGNDQAQGTAFQEIGRDVGSAADESCAGELFLFNPSSTTYVKHFYSRIHSYAGGTARSDDCFCAGYLNTTSDIDAIQFKMASGDFEGTVAMYGVG
tara:strand:+ start:1507 stop:2055 length:549 start_codon:yes stop_codon:yes gene_type:complete